MDSLSNLNVNGKIFINYSRNFEHTLCQIVGNCVEIEEDNSNSNIIKNETRFPKLLISTLTFLQNWRWSNNIFCTQYYHFVHCEQLLNGRDKRGTQNAVKHLRLNFFRSYLILSVWHWYSEYVLRCFWRTWSAGE